MKSRAALAICLICLSPLADATLVTQPSAFSNAFVIDFSEFTPGGEITPGPVQIGRPVGRDIEWSAFPAGAIGDLTAAFGENGVWNAGRGGHTASSIGFPANTMTYTFVDGPVAGVGGFMNYCELDGWEGCSEPSVLIQALALDGSILESYNLVEWAPISTPGRTNAGAFRGIVRAENDIAAFRITGGRFVGLDNLTVMEAVPLPGGLWLIASALIALRIGSRRRQGGSTTG